MEDLSQEQMGRGISLQKLTPQIIKQQRVPLPHFFSSGNLALLEVIQNNAMKIFKEKLLKRKLF